MSVLAPRLPAILRESGVTRLISRWDEAALAAVPEAQRIDLTDRLAGEFELPAERKQMLDQIRQAKPLPLEKARARDRAGKLYVRIWSTACDYRPSLISVMPRCVSQPTSARALFSVSLASVGHSSQRKASPCWTPSSARSFCSR